MTDSAAFAAGVAPDADRETSPLEHPSARDPAPLRVALVGAGRWGTHLARIFLNHPRSRLVAVADPSPDRRAALNDRHQTDPRWDGVALLEDGLAAIEQFDLDAVAIATPAATHFDLVTAALDAGRHVLVEKPLTLTVPECRALCERADRRGRHLMVDHTYLFHPAVDRGLAVVESQQLGPLRYGYAARTHLSPVRQDVDALWDLAIHDIAIFNTWFGDFPDKVRARGAAWLQRGSGAAAGEAPPHPDPDRGLADWVWLELSYPSGVWATVHLCWANPDKQRRLCLAGDRGTLVFDELDSDAPLSVRWGHLQPSGPQFLPQFGQVEPFPPPPGEPLSAVCDRFLEGILSDSPCDRSSGWVGLRLVGVLAAASASLGRGGEPVAVAEFLGGSC